MPPCCVYYENALTTCSCDSTEHFLTERHGTAHLSRYFSMSLLKVTERLLEGLHPITGLPCRSWPGWCFMGIQYRVVYKEWIVCMLTIILIQSVFENISHSPPQIKKRHQYISHTNIWKRSHYLSPSSWDYKIKQSWRCYLRFHTYKHGQDLHGVVHVSYEPSVLVKLNDRKHK